MIGRSVVIDFTIEPYKSMLIPGLEEESKLVIQFLVYKTINEEYDENGVITFTADDFIQYLKDVECINDPVSLAKFVIPWDTLITNQ